MADLVLDTHACVFTLSAPHRLGRGARRALQQVEAGVRSAWIPAAVAAEIVLLRERGRTKIGAPELAEAVGEGALRFLPLDLGQIQEFAAHAGVTDPFDRLIVSACRSIGGVLLTRDRAIAEAGLVRTIWD